MIAGIGVDLVEINRMQGVWKRHGATFAKRILTANERLELEKVSDPVRFLAKRFAVKEAAAKALGTGFQQGLSWQHIEIQHDALGKPLLLIDNSMAEDLNSHVSLSDEITHVVAFVVLERSA